MVVLVVVMLKSNKEQGTRKEFKNIYMRIKENSIPPCRAGTLAHVHMENFHLT